ncbi:DUF2335 domain-containing protein [Limosilactobacillus ingluviei]|uniref:DUF2335 domain-containing protein n=1 Tax=Limosilactobacillus ingluviei TaxID=148604 RepID=UPI0026604C0B|nr:DUF2335 domain-containing protein [Limosilactobacillus ingluviei]
MTTKQDNHKLIKDDQQSVDTVVDHVKQLPRDEQHQVMQKLEMFSGPIPAPHILKQYDEMDPGAAKQIIDNGVEESHHRRQMEEKMLEIGRRRSIRRDWMGYSIGIISIIVGGILIYQDHYVVGTIFSGVTILGLVGQFLGEDSNKTTSDNQHSSDEKPKKSSNDD